jgi:hypothetical protein
VALTAERDEWKGKADLYGKAPSTVGTGLPVNGDPKQEVVDKTGFNLGYARVADGTESKLKRS